MRTTGVTVLNLLGVLLIVCKLCGFLDLSWLIVLSPFWAPLAAVIIIVTLTFLAAFLSFLYSKYKG